MTLARERGAGRSTAVLALAGLALLYLLVLDQGQLLSLVQGATAFDQNLVHEFLHDGRHLLGVPCH
ncbi:MAG: CbtB-domain containing protein [Chloroflexi bacterium]|nr:CbtB-domain containing protein [Chloroflexota bacterium]